MEQKQTAVEWLDRWFRDNPEATHEEGNKALHHAKEMEKKQIIDANEDASTNELGEFLTGEQYYNQEYGNETTEKLE